MGIFGWYGWVHTAVVTGLSPATAYNYTCGTAPYISQPTTMRTLPGVGASTSLYAMVTGDQGTFLPLGFTISAALIEEFARDPFDMTLLVGDVAYAGIGSQSEGELSVLWDVYGQQVQPYASRRPFVTTVGNHESYYNYTAFHNRCLTSHTHTHTHTCCR